MALAESRGIHHVATGHYVQVHADHENTVLCRSADLKKDQSYFLYRLKPAWLSRLLFPVGSMHKAEVWREAEAMGLPVDELKESQEICFVSHGDYRTFLEKETPEAKKPGTFVDETGSPLGQHEGIAFYTPGQRRGLGVATGRRLYVQQVEPSTNTVILGPEETLYRGSCQVGDLNLFTPSLLNAPTEVTVKVRYATPAVKATLQPIHPSALRIQFHEPQRALSPGQSAVFYRDDKVLGGGIIQPF
jgi:tRNA-specific 2-thiouridylase